MSGPTYQPYQPTTPAYTASSYEALPPQYSRPATIVVGCIFTWLACAGAIGMIGLFLIAYLASPPSGGPFRGAGAVVGFTSVIVTFLCAVGATILAILALRGSARGAMALTILGGAWSLLMVLAGAFHLTLANNTWFYPQALVGIIYVAACCGLIYGAPGSRRWLASHQRR